MFHHGRSDGVEPSSLSRCIADADRLAHAIGYGSFASAREDDPPDRSTVSPELAAHVRTLFESERGLFD